MKRKILFFSLMLTFLFASCSNLIDELTVTKEKEANYTVTISDKIENGTVTASPTTAAAGTEITLAAEAASGYTFGSYTVTDAGGKAVTVTDNKFTMPASNVTVSATFTALPPATASYTVKHLQQNIADNNYTLKESETKTGTVGQPTAASAKSYDGFTAQTITQVTVAASGTEVEIKYDRKTYTVTFDSNGGSDVSSQSLRYGATATKPADPTKTATTTTEYTFDGWYSDSGLTTPFSFDTAIAGNIMLYAKWTETAVTPQKTAGSISYATTTVSKTTFDEAFTNELTKTGDGTVTYASSKTDVAEVNTQTGLVTIKGLGETTITATVADSDTYTYATKTASYTLTITYIGTKAPTKAKAVGDIVFTDGSATPYSADLTLTDAQKAAAIALIFYVGTDLNSGDDTTTSRTLGVGLKHNTSGLAWCLNSANARNTNITTIQCPASGSAGALTFTGDRNGSDNLEQIEAFDGVDDTATEANYPAFYIAKNYKDTATNIAGTDYESGWYLPSIAELFQIYANGKGTSCVFDIDAASSLCGGDQFGTGYCYYWSSSQFAPLNFSAYILGFTDGGCYGDLYKSDAFYSVCAVRAFN
ncbi:InlB B-repeat-containing protein [uncultured Treponema sp.]|uniref:InlB B-repeat-containing protein n=1 Tax=uncultured Treponema sp. TaxID=162155 RepID=UPI002622F591|nr:InlB B-repeat-containing protein [uncultured Treponema sp.]